MHAGTGTVSLKKVRLGRHHARDRLIGRARLRGSCYRKRAIAARI
jgi:hypothetical protein